MSWWSSSVLWASTLFSGPQRNQTMPSGDSWPAGQWGASSHGCSSAPRLGLDYRKEGAFLVLTSLHIDAAGLVLVDQGLHLLRSGWREEQGVESGVSLLLIDEFGQVILGHVGFGFSMAAGQERRAPQVCVLRSWGVWAGLLYHFVISERMGGRKEVQPLSPLLQAQPEELTKK